MAGNKCLLDTSVIIHIFKNSSWLISRVQTFSEIYIPSIVVGELFYGAYGSNNIQKHLNQVQSFLNDFAILPVNSQTGDIYGKIKSGLMSKGKPIPENDIWIAAISIQYYLPLFTTDNHFKEIEHLELVAYNPE